MIKQQLDDIKALIRHDRRIWAAAVFCATALLIWLSTSTVNRPHIMHFSPSTKASNPGSDAETLLNDFVAAYGRDIAENKQRNQEMFAQLERQKTDFRSYQEKTTGIFETLVDQFEQLSREVDNLTAAVRTLPEGLPETVRKIEEGPDGIDVIFEPEAEPPAPFAPSPLRASVITPGDYADAVLVSGVTAPVEGNPYPAMFRLTGPIYGPDGSSLDVGEAHLLAAAQGSDSDMRVLFRLQKLALRHADGRRSAVDVDGWVIGPDGSRGMPGRLIDHLGRVIATTAAVSAAAALGERIENRAERRFPDPENYGFSVQGRDVDYAAASAATDAANRLGQVFLERYGNITPVIETQHGLPGVIIFTQPAYIELLDEGTQMAVLTDSSMD